MKKIFLILLIGLFVYGCGGKETSTSRTEEDYVGDGKLFLQRGDMRRAVRAFKEATLRYPDQSEAYFILARTYMHLKEYDQAINNFKSTIRLDPQNGQAYLLLGGCYDLLGDKEEAINQVKKSVVIFQNNQDVENFKKAIAILKGLSQAG